MLSLLFAHYKTRRFADQAIPNSIRHFYSQSYASSLAILAGKGFIMVAPPAGPEAAPFLEFLDLTRERIAPEELDALVRAGGLKESKGQAVGTESLAISRVLDIWTAAGLWRVFGINWRIYFRFYALVSTGACLLIYLMGRKLGESYWAGLFAALLFFASPAENLSAVRSVRDVSSAWFFTLGFFVYVCVAERFRSQKWNLASLAFTGAATAIGIGWRTDALLLAPYLLLAVVALLICKRRGWKYTSLGAAMFLAGALATHIAIGRLGPKVENRAHAGAGFHVAYYGNAVRYNVLGLENSFEIPRNDEAVYYAALHAHARNGRAGPPPGYLTREYGDVCRAMYLETLRYNAFDWFAQFPLFWWKALNGLPEPGRLQGEYQPHLETQRIPWARPVYGWVLDPLTKALPYLFALGAVGLLLLSTEQVRGICLAVFTIYYAAIFLVVLPEHKHFPSLLPPLAVLGGAGAWALLRLLRPGALLAGMAELPPRLARACLWTAVVAMVLWSLTFGAAYAVSINERQAYLEDIAGFAAAGADAGEAIRDRKVFSIEMLPRSSTQPDPAGYLLKIKAGANSGSLLCRHIRGASGSARVLAYATRHQLHSQREQFFYVTCLQGSRYGDPRPYRCTVTLDGDAELVSCKRLDIARWQRPPFSTVFFDGQRCAGSPRLDGGGLSTAFFALDGATPLGIPAVEALHYPGLTETTPLTAVFDAQAVAPSPQTQFIAIGPLEPAAPEVKLAASPAGTEVTTLPARNSYAVLCRGLAASKPGTYHVRLIYTETAGAIGMGALTSDETHWLAHSAEAKRRDGQQELTISAPLKQGETFSAVITNQNAAGASTFVIKEFSMSRAEDALPPLPAGSGMLQSAGREGLDLARFAPAAQGATVTMQADGVHVTTLPRRAAYAAAYPPLIVRNDGVYLISLRYRAETGGLAFGVLSGDQSRWLAQSGPPTREGNEHTRNLNLTLKAGDVFVIMVTNDATAADAASQGVITDLQCSLCKMKKER